MFDRATAFGALRGVALAASLLLSSAAFAADGKLPEGVDPASGFRMGEYRAPTPDFVPGGRVVETAEVAERAKDGKTVLIDAFGGKGAGPDPKTGEWRMSESHATIPGATWLPEIGLGKLDEAHESYFRRNLGRLTGDDKAKPILFFCKSDCWHSWNAAKRAAEWGYSDVMWFPLGVDGWTEMNLSLTPAKPQNFLEGAS